MRKASNGSRPSISSEECWDAGGQGDTITYSAAISACENGGQWEQDAAVAYAWLSVDPLSTSLYFLRPILIQLEFLSNLHLS